MIDGAHLGAEDAELDRAVAQLIELRHRPHQLDTVFFGFKPAVDFDERHDLPLFPEIGRGRLAAHLAIHRAFEQDRADDLVAAKRRGGHDAHPHLVDQPEHLGFAVIGGVRNAVEAQRSRRRPAALVEGGDKAALLGHLGRHLVIGHHHHSRVGSVRSAAY